MPDAAAVIAAVKDGDAAQVRTLVAARPELAAARDEEGKPAVRVALYHRQRAALDALLEAGPELDDLDVAAVGDVAELRQRLGRNGELVAARTPDGFTPLHFAAFFGGAATVELLLGAGADPDAVAANPTRVRPLHSAAAAHDAESVHLLLTAGADPDARQAGGFTALHAAAHGDDATIAALLLQHGADRTLRNDAGADAEALARANGASAVLALLGAPQT